MSGGRTTLSATSKKGKKKHLRTAPSTNRTSSAEKYLTPNPTGMGSPLVLVWDGKGNLLLDLMQTKTNFYGFALEKFTYEFKEKEEDKCTIVLSATSVELLNNLVLFKGQKLLVSWGYMDGNLRPPVNVVVIDTKETYDIRGFGLTIICSDNLSFFSRGKSTLVVKLESSVKAIEDLLTPNTQDLDNDISTLRGWKIWEYGKTKHFEFGRGYSYTVGQVKSTGKFPTTSSEDASNYLSSLQAYYERNIQQRGIGQVDSLPSHTWDNSNVEGVFKQGAKSIYDIAPTDFNAAILAGDLTRLTATAGSTPTEFGIPTGPTSTPTDFPPLPDPQPQITEKEKELVAKIPWALRGYNISVVGKNAQNICQNTLDKVAPYPMQVTGHDGKVITYNKNRAINGPSVREYIFKGAPGNLLEFSYDTKSQYSDDTNALRNFSIDPKTGALTQKDFLNDKKKVEDATTPTQYKQLRFDEYIQDVVQDVALNNPQDLPQLPYDPIFKGKTGRDASNGNTTFVAYGGEYNPSEPSMALARGNAQEIVLANDQIAPRIPHYSCPTPYLNEVKETMENQLKNLKRGEQEKIKAHATILGDPQITSGVKVSFKGLSNRRNGSYFLTGCIHEIDPSSGFTCKFEMYFVGDISQAVNTVETTTSKGDIEKKAKDLKDKKITLNPNYQEIRKRGYYLKTDFLKENWEIEAEKVDKNWNVEIPGTFYDLAFTKRDGTISTYRIKIPITTNGKTQNPFKAFGYDAIYDLLGCHDELYVRTHIKMGRIELNKNWEPTQEIPDAAPKPW